MAKKIRVIVVGAGSIALHRHLPEFVARNDVQLVAVVDANVKRAEAMAEQFGAPHGLAELDKAFALGADAVSVCSPNVLHAPQSIAASKAGMHVLCEKPMATTMAEARAMIKAAKAAGKQLMIAHNQRMMPAHVKGRELLKEGIIGKCVAFSTAFSHGGPEGWSADKDKGFFFKKAEAVLGALGDLGVHKLDLIRFLLDDEIDSVGAVYGTQVKARCTVDDTAFASLTMKSGAIGQMFAGWVARPGSNATILYGTAGQIHLYDDPDYPVVVHRSGGERICIQPPPNPSGSGIIQAFVDAIRTGKPNPIPGEEGAASLAAVLACMDAGSRKEFVKPAKV